MPLNQFSTFGEKISNEPLSHVLGIREDGKLSSLPMDLLGASTNGIKVVSDGTALAAAVPDFAGQWIMALDGGIGRPLVSAPGHHTDGLIFLSTNTFFNGVVRLKYISQESGIAENYFHLAGSYIDNVARIQNDTGGFHGIRATDKDAGEIGAVGWAKIAGGGGGFSLNSGCGYMEVGNPNGGSVVDVHRHVIRQYVIYNGDLYIYTRIQTGEDGVIRLFGMDDPDTFGGGAQGPLGVCVAPTGEVGIGGLQQTGSACCVNGILYVKSNAIILDAAGTNNGRLIGLGAMTVQGQDANNQLVLRSAGANYTILSSAGGTLASGFGVSIQTAVPNVTRVQVSDDGTAIRTPTTAPSTAAFQSVSFYLDEGAGASSPVLKLKVVSSNGTIKTGTVTLS